MSEEPNIVVSKADFELLVTQAMAEIKSAGLEQDESVIRKLIADNLIVGGIKKAPEEVDPNAVTVTTGGKLRVTPVASDGVMDPAIETEISKQYFYERPDDATFIEWYVNGRRAGTVHGNLLIAGPSGSGKTESIIHAGARLGLPVHVISCASITSIEKWIGHKEVNRDGTFFVESDVLRIIEGKDSRFPPGIALFDEITRLHSTFHNITFPLLDGRRSIWVPEMHGHIEVNPDVIVMATANIGEKFTGTFRMDHAMRERFSFTLEREFPPAKEEVKVLVNRTGVGDKFAELMVDIGNQARIKWKANDLSFPISTRLLLSAAELVRDGSTIARAFELTVLPLFSSDGGPASERELIKGIVTGKGAA